MPVPDTSGIPPFADFDMLKNKVNEVVTKYNNLLVNLDSLNVVELNAGTVIVYDLAGGPGTITLTKDGMTVNNGTYDTFTVDINGNVTMTSALVRSSAGYPKVELNSASNLIAAFQDANNHVDVTPNAGGSPGISWTVANVLNAYLQSTVAGPLYSSFNSTPITIQPATNLNLSIAGGGLNMTIGNNLTINGSTGYSGSISYTKTITSDGMGNYFPVNGTITVTKGIITSVS